MFWTKKKIKWESTGLYSRIKPDNNNSADDVIMPSLTDEYLDEVIAKNRFKIVKVKQLENGKFMHIYESELYLSGFMRVTFQKYKENSPLIDKLEFNGRIFLPTKIRVDIPKGYDFDIRNRSGNFKKNINVIMGLIDNPYTGEMGLQIANYNNVFTEIKFTEWKLNGTDENKANFEESSIAQIKLNKVYKRKLEQIKIGFDNLKSVMKKGKIRGDKGFGTTYKTDIKH